MQLTKSQNKAIDALFDEYMKQSRRIVDFCAPTGSGKTFMASNFISKVFGENDNKKTMIIVATVSNAELPKAFAKKINEYKEYLFFNDFLVEFRNSPYSTKNVKVEHIKGFELENNKVLVFGTSSFGKKKLFTELGLLENFILEAKEKNWNIIYIRDEAHKGGATNRETSELFYKRFDDKMVNLARFTIQMTATPKGYHDLIKLNEEELLEDGVKLLKNNLVYNEFQRNTSTSDELIRECIRKFKEVQEEYKTLDTFIRPALLIQVDSKSKNVTQEEHNKTIEKIINIVDKEEKLKYLKYFSNDIQGNAKENLTLESASKKDSNYDVIIFKVGPATGWDIPRACMLLQIREVSSESLNIQTIGRIKRNPIPNLEYKKITDKYYIYSNYQEGQRSLASYKLKNKFINLKLYQGNLYLDDKSIELLKYKYDNLVKRFLESSAIHDFILENSQKNGLSIENKQFTNKNGTNNEYSIFANSIFRLKIWNDVKIQENKKYFTDGLYLIIYTLAKKLSVSKEIVIYTIITYLSEIKAKYAKSYKLQRSNEKYKIVPNKSLKRNYQMWISKNKGNQFDVSNIDNYGYSLIRRLSDKYAKDMQFLDSSPEAIFMTNILDEIDEENYGSKIKFFTKMPTLTSEIFFEYFKTEDMEKHKAFIDFALVTDKKILMIEVKGWNDYDERKTQDLLYSFKKYKEQNSELLVELLVCYSGKQQDGNIKKPEIKFLESDSNIKSWSIRTMLRSFLKEN